MPSNKNSADCFERAKGTIPGGVNSPVRAFKNVGGTPLFIRKAEGSRITDIDGNTYIDFVGSWGPMILGHAHESITKAVQDATKSGLSFGAPTEAEVQLAEKICQMVPSIDSVRLVNSGTEATMSAIRLARGYTGRDRLIKFEGCYHGHADCLLVAAGSGALTLGTPDSAGVPKPTAKDTIVLPYNNPGAVKKCFQKHGKDIAAIIVEPVAGNMGCVLPCKGFLETLREECDRFQSILIFDEVMTGFRLAPGGAQERFGILPDLTCLGKIIGGGLPVGAYGGKKDIMEHIAPQGTVYQAGTLSGNPLAVSAGLATLQSLSAPGTYDRLEENSNQFAETLRGKLSEHNMPLCLNQIGSMFCLYFHKGPIENFESVMNCDSAKFKKFFHALLTEGIYLAPSPYECGFISLAHTPEDLDWVATRMVNTLQNAKVPL